MQECTYVGLLTRRGIPEKENRNMPTLGFKIASRWKQGEHLSSHNGDMRCSIFIQRNVKQPWKLVNSPSTVPGWVTQITLSSGSQTWTQTSWHPQQTKLNSFVERDTWKWWAHQTKQNKQHPQKLVRWTRKCWKGSGRTGFVESKDHILGVAMCFVLSVWWLQACSHYHDSSSCMSVDFGINFLAFLLYNW